MAKAKAAEYVKLQKAMKDASAALKKADDKTRPGAKGAYDSAKAAFGAYQFKTLAGKRVSKALSALDNVAKLGGRGYVHTEEQRTKIFNALDAKLAAMKAAFSTTQKAAAAVFEV